MREFWTVHSDLPREGPGEPADVAWAIARAGLSGRVRILDAGCGPGADVETFAEMLPEALITGVDTHAAFIEEARARIGGPRPRIALRVGDMREADGPFDLIWSAGALYFIGIEEALPLLGAKLAPGGHVCFTEPVMPDSPTMADRAFWGGDPADDEGRILERIAAAGFECVDRRRISEAAWEAYYGPMRSRLAMLRGGNPTPELLSAIADAQAEIDAWDRNDGRNGYLQLLVRPA